MVAARPGDHLGDEPATDPSASPVREDIELLEVCVVAAPHSEREPDHRVGGVDRDPESRLLDRGTEDLVVVSLVAELVEQAGPVEQRFGSVFDRLYGLDLVEARETDENVSFVG
jgi:hypothetical protein